MIPEESVQEVIIATVVSGTSLLNACSAAKGSRLVVRQSLH